MCIYIHIFNMAWGDKDGGVIIYINSRLPFK